MYAEAKNEVSGPDASVYSAINAVRTRFGVNMPPVPTGISQADMRDRIRHERRIELALEGQRYFDSEAMGIGQDNYTDHKRSECCPANIPTAGYHLAGSANRN
jgi:hypothetical protein